ncbi:hypothetical protein JNG70_18655, partial [Proteus mirabilis]|nr:hypothetical protein [Proteus mirabilis]
METKQFDCYWSWKPVRPFFYLEVSMLNGDGITYKNEELTNDEFWPDLNLGDFQKSRA